MEGESLLLLKILLLRRYTAHDIHINIPPSAKDKIPLHTEIQQAAYYVIHNRLELGRDNARLQGLLVLVVLLDVRKS